MSVSETIPLVTVEELHKCFPHPVTGDTIVALDALSITVAPGELVALIGPDGAGKTTCMRILCGLLRADGGRAVIDGIDVSADPQAVQNRVGYMPQKFGLYEDLSVQENLNLYADLHALPNDVREQRFQRLLAMTGLAPFTKRPAGKLSGGMKQKLGLACTLLSAPKLIILDEPTVGVDPLSRRELWDILQQLAHDDNLSILVSTAYMDEASLCHKVYILHEGKLLAQGSPEAITNKADGACYLVTPPPHVPARLLQAALIDDTPHVIDAVPQGGAVRFISRTSDVSQLAVYAHFPDLVPQATPPTLEDAFMMILKEHSQPQAEASHFVIDYTSTASSEEAPADVEVKDVMRKFGDFIAVNHVSFSVHRGEIFGLLGPNGAGKSTTFRMLCGLLPASSGALSVLGYDLRRARAKARAGLGYVAQKFSLYGTLTVEENLEFFAGAYGLSPHAAKERIEEILHQFDLDTHRYEPAGELPGGYKQRLSMAAALLHKPGLLFLDEPTSGIDPLARRIFWRQITALAAAGTTVIITTHFMEEAEYCDRILIQDRGCMVALGTPAEIRRRAGNPPSMNEAFINIVEQKRNNPVTTAANNRATPPKGGSSS